MQTRRVLSCTIIIKSRKQGFCVISNCEITSRKTDKTHNDDDIYFFRSRLTDTALKERRAHRQRRTERNAG